MKGGKDMKKTYKFYFTDQVYALKESEQDVFTIPKDTLEFDGNVFYHKIFKEFSLEQVIEVKNQMSEEEMNSDKFASYIFEMLKEMISDIVTKIEEEKVL